MFLKASETIVVFPALSSWFFIVLLNKGSSVCCCHHLSLEIHCQTQRRQLQPPEITCGSAKQTRQWKWLFPGSSVSQKSQLSVFVYQLCVVASECWSLWLCKNVLLWRQPGVTNIYICLPLSFVMRLWRIHFLCSSCLVLTLFPNTFLPFTLFSRLRCRI